MEGRVGYKPRPQISPHAGNFWFLGIFGGQARVRCFPKFHQHIKSPLRPFICPTIDFNTKMIGTIQKPPKSL